MFGCLASRAQSWASRVKSCSSIAASFGSVLSFGSMTLRATRRSRAPSRASYTIPMAPRPSSRVSVYFPKERGSRPERMPGSAIRAGLYGGGRGSVNAGKESRMMIHGMSRGKKQSPRALRGAPGDASAILDSDLAAIRLAADPLDLDALALHDLLQGDHVGGGLVDGARERDRALQHGRELLRVLDARIRILVLAAQVDVRHALLEL